MFARSETLLVLASAAALARGVAVTCYGDWEPDYAACDAIMQTHFQDDSYTIPPPNGYACAGYGVNGDPDSANCKISICWTDTSKQAFPIVIRGDYELLKSDCSPNHAGGSTVDSKNDGYYIQVGNNPNYDPPGKRDVESTSDVSRQHARDMLQQRADDKYNIVSASFNVETGVEYAITGREPAGSMHTITSGESKTTGISYSMEIGVDLFELFTASAGLTIDQSYTQSNSVGDSINVDCASGQEGIIYWVPLYDVYSGYYSPSGTNEQISVPADNAQARGNFKVRCLG